MAGTPKIRDLIYLDFNKTASIMSQFEGGLLQEIQSEYEDTSEKHRGAATDWKVVSGELGSGITQRIAQLESRKLHHDLLARVEQKLFSQKLAVDLNTDISNSDITVEVLRTKLAGKFYVRAEGWVVIEDFERILGILKRYN